MTKRDDKQIIDLLENLPKHNDERSKEEIYEQIALQFSEKPHNKKKKFIPYFSVAAILLCLLSLPFLFHNATEQSSMERRNATEEASLDMESETFHDSAQQHEESESFGEREQQEASLITEDVLTEVPADKEIIHFAIHDETMQYIIPLTFLVPEEANMESYYTKLDEILEIYQLYPENFLLKDIEFAIDFDTKQAVLTGQNRLLKATGSSDLLSHLLSEMFLPYGIDKVRIVNELNEREQIIDLSSHRTQRASYLLYEENYIIVPQDHDTTVREAMLALKEMQRDASINSVMDENIEFTVEDADETVIVEFAEETIQEEDVTKQMIEAILLTAKSYGYEDVQFIHLPIKQLRNYHFDNPIPVPVAVNVIAEIE